MKKIVLLGSTGSIGTQALQVIQNLGYAVVGLSAHSNTDLLLRQIQALCPLRVAVAEEAAADRLSAGIGAGKHRPQILRGANAARDLVLQSGADMVLNAVVGIAGLDATLAALSQGISVALANKESLVAGGELVAQTAAKTGAALLPVDSEHSAIFQCLQGSRSAKELRKILLTASGGPFYGKKKGELALATKQDALRHPNWKMGQKITVDSATMMNKGLELIEAMHLFSLPAEKIDILVQRESVIHSMVEFCDASVLAQLGAPDMRLPIQYALTWPHRVPGPAAPLDFSRIETLHFGKPDRETFRCLAACEKAAAKGGLAPCAANGANEEAVALFLREEISFLRIGELVEGCVDRDSYAGTYTLEDVYTCDEAARRYVREKSRKVGGSV